MKLSKNFILRNIAGQNVLVATGEKAIEYNGLMTVSSTATFLLQNYEKCSSAEELLKKMLDEFDIDPETAAKDLAGFTNMALERGIIEYTDPEKNW